MKKQGRRIPIMLLCALLMTVLFSVSAFAAEADKITVVEQTQSGGNITFTVTVPQGGTLYAARYDMNGRMQGVYAGERSGKAYTVSVPEKTGKLSFFSFDGDNKPLTAAVHDLIVADADKNIRGGSYDNVIITSSVSDGDVTLNGVTVRDKLVVQGGGSNSVHLNGCTVLGNITVDKTGGEAPRLDLQKTSVPTISAESPVIIEADKASPVKGVEAKSDVTVQGAATTVESVTVPAEAANDGVKLTVDGAKVETVAAEKPLTIEAKNNASPIETVTAKDDVTVKGDAAKIETVEVPKNVATKPEINVESGTVSTVDAKSEAAVGGAENAVANVKAEAPVKVASQTVVTVTVTVQVTVTVTGNAPVEVAVETTQEVNISATGAATVEVSTTQTTAVDVKLNDTAVEHIHKWTKDSETPATCAAEGTVTYICSGEGTCSLNKTKTETLRKLPHREEIDDAVPASCEKDGKTAGKHCSECNEVLVAQTTIPALGHAYGAVAYVWNGASCTATRVCENDAAHTLSETKAGVYVKDTDATCTTNEKGHYAVTFNDTQFGSAATAANSVEKANTATGHSFASEWKHDETYHWHAATCAHSNEVSDKAAHIWDAGVESEGEMHYTCTVCPATKTELVSATRVWMAQQLCELLDINVNEYDTTLSFTDCGELTDAQRQTINAVVAAGVMNPAGETEFAPNGVLLRSQTAMILYSAAKNPAVAGNDSYTDVTEGTHYYNAVTALLNYGVLSDEDTFDPNSIAVQRDVKGWLAALKTRLACKHTSCGEWSTTETTHTHTHTCNDCHLIITGEHIWNEGEVTTEPTGTTAGVMTYTCTVCNATKTEEIPALYASVSTLEELAAAMENTTLQGAVLNADIEVPGGTLPAGKTLVVPAGKTLTVSGTLNVYGTLENEGTINNQHFIDVLGGTLINSGAITGIDDDGDGVYDTNIGIEGGATLTNTGTINDSLAVADYYFADHTQYKLCSVSGVEGAASDNYDYMAVAFGAEPIQGCLSSDKGYEFVVPCGVTPWDGSAQTVNAIELGGVTVPAGKTLLLKASVFDGKNTYRNSFTVNSGVLNISENADVVCVGSTVSVAVGAKIHAKDRSQLERLNADAYIYEDEDGYTLTANLETVRTYEQFAAALESDAAAGVYIDADITVPAQDHWTVLRVAKPVLVAGGKTLTVAAFSTEGDKSGFRANDLTIVAGGSLTLEEGAKLATEQLESGENEWFYRYTGRVCVVGGTLDVSRGTVADGSFFNFNYTGDSTDSDALILGENKPEIEFSVHNDAQLRAAIADGKCTGGVIVEDNFALESDLIVTKLVLVNDQWMMTVPTERTLTVAEGGTLQISGALLVNGGTLSNAGTVYSYGVIDIIGGTLNNAGTGTFEGLFIPSGDGGEECLSLLALEHSSFSNANSDEAMHTYMDFVDYYRNDEVLRTMIAEGTTVNFASDLRTKVAAAFGDTQTVKAMEDSSYEAFIPCGTATSGVNTVELGGLTVPSGAALVLKESVFDGTDTYLNKFVVSEGTTLTLKPKAGIDCKGGKLELLGELDRKGENWFRVSDDVTLGGKVVHNPDELKAALAKGGTIYLCELPGSQMTLNNLNDWESQYHISATEISKNAELVALGNKIAVFFDKGFTLAENTTLTFNGLNVVAGADSEVKGTVKIGGNAQLVVQGKNETTLTNNGTIVVGGEDMSFWGAALSVYQPGNRILNNGTVDIYGDLIFGENVDQTIGGTGEMIFRSYAEVKSRDEFLAAMQSGVVRNVKFTQDVTLLSGDTFKGRGTQYEIPAGVTVTLAKAQGNNDEVVTLEQGSTLKVYGQLVANCTVYAYGGIDTPENEPREKYLVNDYNIHFMKNFADFGEYVRNAVGDRLDAVTAGDITAYKAITEDNWPGGEWNEGFFAFLVKYGGVQPRTDANDADRKYWPAHEPISYGDARAILGNVYKAICGEVMPDTVCINAIDPEHMDDGRCNALLTAFLAALPKETDGTTESFTLIRDNVNEGNANLSNDGRIISGKCFTNAVTITCDTRYLKGDNFGGELKFVGCDFTQGVTVVMSDNVNYRVDFSNTCIGAVTVKLPQGKTMQGCRENRTNIEFFGVNGMNIDTKTNTAFADINDWGHDKTVSFTLNGLTITDEAEGAFGVNARYDENGRDEQNQPIFIPTVEVRGFAKTNTIKLGGSYAGKLRVCGTVDVSGVTLTGTDSRIELSNQGGSDITLGGRTITVCDDCGEEYSFTGTGTVIVPNGNQNARISVNGVDLGTPHIFGEYGDGIFFPLNNAAVDEDGVLSVGEKILSITVEQGEWLGDYAGNWKELKCKVDTTQPGKIHLVGVEGKDWINDPGNVRVTVKVAGGCTVVYEPMMWKPIQVGEFVEQMNKALLLNGGNALSLSKLGLTTLAENEYLRYGSAKTILTAAWTAMDKAGAPDFGRIIDDRGYWDSLDDWTWQVKEATEKNDNDWLRDLEGRNPDNWTRSWNDAKNMLRKFRGELGMDSVNVTSAGALLDALEQGFTEIYVTNNIILLDGKHDDGNFAASVYLNRADGVEEQRIYVKPGVTLSVGNSEKKVKLDINDGVKVILCVDKDNPENHGVLSVSNGSCVNVFGGLDTPEGMPDEDYDDYVVKGKDANVSYKKRIAEFGGRLYERLLEKGYVEALGAAALTAHAGEDSWPDDEWSQKGMAFLKAYAGITALTDGDRTYWPSWDYLRYGKALDILEKIYIAIWNKIDSEHKALPDTVALGDEDWTPDAGNILDDGCLDELLDKFMAVLPKEADSTTTSFTVTKDNEQTISNKFFTQSITITCTCVPTPGDNFGGDIKFVNCEFDAGVTVKLAGGVNYNVRLDNSCIGDFAVDANGTNGVDNTGVNFFGTTGVTINGLSIDTSDLSRDEDYNINVRFDKNGGAYISTVDIEGKNSEKTIEVGGRYAGKLRVSGNVDVSGVTLTDDDSWIELSNQGDSDITLGGNSITVCDDCGGSYSFTTSGGSINVVNHNGFADITVNKIHVGSPHIFGSEADGVFLALSSMNGIPEISLQKWSWNEAEEMNQWMEIPFVAKFYDENDDGAADKLHLERENEDNWIKDPNNTRLSITFTDGTKLCYDPLWWKDIFGDEFAQVLKDEFGVELDPANFVAYAGEDGFLRYGDALAMLSAVWTSKGKDGDLPADVSLSWKEDDHSMNWGDAHDMLDRLRSALGISETSPAAAAGWSTDDGIHYYDGDGAPVTGWKNDIPGWEGSWLYFYEDGAMATGWKNDIPGWVGSLFYFDQTTGVMATGWKSDIPGWVGSWFYFDPNTGVMATGYQEIDGQWHYFDQSTGEMLVNTTTPDGYTVDENGVVWV